MLYDLPYFHDIDYIDFLNFNNSIYSIYYHLNSNLISSARVINYRYITNLEDTLSKINSNIKKYILFNARYNNIIRYDEVQINNILDEIKNLKSKHLLDGIIFLDYYIIELLVKEDKLLFKDIELIPSVNCFIDSIEKLESYFSYLRFIGVNNIPNKIVLDRSLNRNINKLKEVSDYIKLNYKDIKIEILVNEGCLYNCPYKINHDIFISLINDNTGVGMVYLNNLTVNNKFKLEKLNIDQGCLKMYSENKNLILSSPFIRPEDIKYIEEYVDIIKISGRTLGKEFIEMVYNSYNNKEYNGNIIDILDTSNYLKDIIYIDNETLPKNFFEIVSKCNKDCYKCKYCFNL